jgi:type II secretory pathway component PulF
VHLCVHIALAIVLVIALLEVTPRAEKHMKDHGLNLPSLTIQVLDVSRWFGSYLVVLGLVCFPILGIDWLLLFTPRLAGRSKRLSTLWAGISLVLLLLGLLLTGVALVLPYAKLAVSLDN